MGILCTFRTAFAQGLDENMRRKLARLGLAMPRWLFVTLDHLCHTVPPALLLAAVVRRKQRVHPMNSVYCLVLSTWFAFRQNAHLDASNIYVPHPWKRAWAAILVASFTTPRLVNALIDRCHRRAVGYALLLLAPWLSSKLDPHLRRTYNFECRVQNANRKIAEKAHSEKQKHHGSIARSASEVPLRREDST